MGFAFVLWFYCVRWCLCWLICLSVDCLGVGDLPVSCWILVVFCFCEFARFVCLCFFSGACWFDSICCRIRVYWFGMLATVFLVFCFVGYWWVWFVSGSLCGVCVIAWCFYV